MSLAVFCLAVMLALFVMNKHLSQGGCVQCGKRIKHADDCPSQRRRND